MLSVLVGALDRLLASAPPAVAAELGDARNRQDMEIAQIATACQSGRSVKRRTELHEARPSVWKARWEEIARTRR